VPLLEWRDAEQRLPWGILLLFGGGLALGDSFQSSGLARAVGEALSDSLANQRPLGVIAAITTLITFLTEVTSNTATATVMLQILSAVAPALEAPPAAILLPAALAASCAFMLPVATAPNAIVFGTGKVSIRAMVLHGFLLNWIAVALISLYLYFVGLPLLGISLAPS
jgi:sodium-dependent dicarboxylate transporter 2/3/5